MSVGGLDIIHHFMPFKCKEHKWKKKLWVKKKVDIFCHLIVRWQLLPGFWFFLTHSRPTGKIYKGHQTFIQKLIYFMKELSLYFFFEKKSDQNHFTIFRKIAFFGKFSTLVPRFSKYKFKENLKIHKSIYGLF